MFNDILVFVDRWGDDLKVTPRDLSEGGNPIPDPTISISKGFETHSIVMTDDELHTVMMRLGASFGYDVRKK